MPVWLRILTARARETLVEKSLGAPTSAAAKNSGPRSHPHLSLPFGLSLGFYASMLLCLTWPPGSSYSNDLTVRMEPSCAPAVKSYDAAKNAR